jgi:type VI protein secretion system component Hcp
MWLKSFLQTWARNRARGTRGGCNRHRSAVRVFRPRFDCLEDRTLPSTMVGMVFDDGAGPLPVLAVESYTWGATHPDGSATSMQDFTITLTPGSIEPGLWGHLAVGEQLDTATIQLSKPNPQGPLQVYTTYTLTNVTISSFTTSKQGDDVPLDTIGLHFDKITETFRRQNPDGTLGPANTASYNQVTATSEGAGSLGGPISTTSLTASSSSTVYGDSITFTATVSPSDGGTPTGAVHFFDGTTDLSGPVSLMTVSGQEVARFTVARLGAGTHTIRAHYVDPTNVYSDSSGATSVMVSKAALIVTANDQTKITGEANPTFTVSYSGFVLGEGPAVLGGTLTFSTTATTSSPPGAYPITPSGLTSDNYAITFISGTLTVLSFDQATTNLVAQVDQAGLPQGIQNALNSQLRAAIASFSAGNTIAGKNLLEAFMIYMSAQRGKKIDGALADALIAYAQRIINAIG